MSSAPDALTAALADRYRIERELGAGGMATVYLAEDIKHKRQVAVKVFRPELAATLGPGRFAREIEVAARLQHPHILALHDSGEAAGFLYYVMPYVEGVSLRQRLTEQGELPIPDAVRILTEIVEALAYAHGQGVVHRDLKPDNIMLSGRHPMVMDFGIAKAVSAATDPGGLTTAGVALGTPTYMAPEQASADPHLDHRVDIYALGAMGYELLTGRPPFTGMSAQQILAAHMSQTPAPLSSRRATIPPALASLLMRCLEKRPADRPQSADEVLHVLEALATPSGGQVPTSARLAVGARRRWVAPTIAGAALLAVVAAIQFMSRSQPGPIAATHTQLTFDGDVEQVEISPGGDLLAVARQTSDSAVVFVRDRAGGSTVRIGRFNGVRAMRWSPDARSLLVNNDIYPRLGGPARSVPCGMVAVWSPDGTRIACWSVEPRTRIRFVDLASLDTMSVAVPDTVGFKLVGDWSPNGAFLALSTRVAGLVGGQIWILDISRRAWSNVVSDTAGAWNPRWSPDGKSLYYISGDELHRLRMGSDGKRLGEATVLQRGIAAHYTFSIAADGRTLVHPRSQTHSNVWIAAETGSVRSGRFVVRQLTQGTALNYAAELSPDGRWAAYGRYRTSDGGSGDLFVVPAEGGEPRQITTGGRVMGVPAWSPEGDRLAYVAQIGARRLIAMVHRDGGTEVMFGQTEAGFHLSWAPGTRILYQRAGNRNYHFLDPRTGAEAPLLATDTLGWVVGATALSNDGRVVVHWNRKRHGLWLVASPDSTQLLLEEKDSQALLPAGRSSDGRSIYALEFFTNRLLEVAISDGSVRRIIPPPLPKAHCTVSERQRLNLVCDVEQAFYDAWMIEDFDPGVPRVKKKP